MLFLSGEDFPSREQRLGRWEYESVTVNEQDWKHELQEIRHRLDLQEARQTERERAVIDEAVLRANTALMARFGVDINDHKSVEAFSKSLQFGQAMQGTMTKAAWAFLSAFCGGMGMALWVIVNAAFGKAEP
jgi:phosphoribosylformimino-5-aminoimidazole carboxamide ribonucleotide (ProFAR) isomerase